MMDTAIMAHEQMVKSMHESFISCDICGKILQGTGRYQCAELMTALKSVTIKLLWDDSEVDYDLCPSCKARMERYLKKEAKKDTCLL